MLVATMTAHVVNDRLDRLAACVEHLGMSKFVLEVPSSYGSKKATMCLTSTGIILVMDKQTNTVITGYMAEVKQVAWMYHRAGYSRVPDKMMNRIHKNCSRYAYLLTM